MAETLGAGPLYLYEARRQFLPGFQRAFVPDAAFDHDGNHVNVTVRVHARVAMRQEAGVGEVNEPAYAGGGARCAMPAENARIHDQARFTQPRETAAV